MEGELIFLGFIMLIGQIILLQMWNNNWFKKENFKIQKSNVMAENKLKLRKLEKEMGLKPTKGGKTEEKSTLNKLGGLAELLPLLKMLDEDQLSGLVDRFIGGTDTGDEEQDEGLVDTLMGYAEEHPDVVKGLLEGISKIPAGSSVEKKMDNY